MERQKKWNKDIILMIKWLSYHAQYKSNLNFNIPTSHPYLVMSDTCIGTDEAEKLLSLDNKKMANSKNYSQETIQKGHWSLP